MANGLYRDQLARISEALTAYADDHGPLLGIQSPEDKTCLCEQVISSQRRIAYIDTLMDRSVDADRCNPHSEIFDPIRGAIFRYRSNEIDEAVWLTFVQTHFGKHERDGWLLAANVLGSFGEGPIWTFEKYAECREDFDRMLLRCEDRLSDKDISGCYSNHRKYQSKNPEKISRVFRSYYDWQTEYGSFSDLVTETHKRVGQNPEEVFESLYKSMRRVYGFGGGRLGRFDFLTMIGKLSLAPISPGSVYLRGATGPLAGARLLFMGNVNHDATAAQLEPRMNLLNEYLEVGMQVIEDSICNWQKSPNAYVYFRG